MGLYKKEVVITQTSSIEKAAAFTWTQNWLDNFYQGAGGEDDFFADVFDSRDKTNYRVFHPACEAKFNLSELVIQIGWGSPDDSPASGSESVSSSVSVTAAIGAIEDGKKYALNEVDNGRMVAVELIKTESTAALKALGDEYTRVANELDETATAQKSELAQLWEEAKESHAAAVLELTGLRDAQRVEFAGQSAAYKALTTTTQALLDKVEIALTTNQNLMNEVIRNNQQAAEYNEQARAYMDSLSQTDEQNTQLLAELEQKVKDSTTALDESVSKSQDILNELEDAESGSMEGEDVSAGVSESRVIELIEENKDSGGDDAMVDSSGEVFTAMEAKQMINDAIAELKASLVPTSSGSVEIEIDPVGDGDMP